ncbi:hypothetical protein ACRC6Q_16600 [Planococcus sp. SE5232]|uniref:hypothetical protein n=1 Tax=unclassified Planococcus (in: firmicutes) TaxID=2662419 RepID=UPI003D6AFD32
MEFIEVPENQLTIFDMLQDKQESAAETFSEEKANWHQERHWIKLLPTDWVCNVIGIVPASVLSPSERTGTIEIASAEWQKQQSIWKEYAYSISKMIPYHERGEEDANGWSAACEILEKSRDERKPIELFIWKWQSSFFKDLEVIEYIQEMKTEDEVNAVHT